MGGVGLSEGLSRAGAGSGTGRPGGERGRGLQLLAGSGGTALSSALWERRRGSGGGTEPCQGKGGGGRVCAVGTAGVEVAEP